LRLTLEKVHSVKNEEPEFLEVDAVIVATGYSRDAHEDMLKELEHLKPNKSGEWHVRRNYQIDFNNELVDQDAGIWLQGANESSHGISDTLLSILATRSGEIVDSIFGSRLKRNCETNRGPGYKG
jgi:L-ornithine N5-oxygenase